MLNATKIIKLENNESNALTISPNSNNNYLQNNENDNNNQVLHR